MLIPAALQGQLLSHDHTAFGLIVGLIAASLENLAAVVLSLVHVSLIVKAVWGFVFALSYKHDEQA